MDTPRDQPQLRLENNERARGNPAFDPQPTIVLSANSSWNLLHFRGALLRGLNAAGYHLVAFVPVDDRVDELRACGVRVEPMPMTRSGMNPIADAALLLRYVSTLRRIRPAAYCGFTIKPNVYGGIAARIADVAAINNVTGLGTMFLSRRLMWRLARRLYRAALKRSRTVFFHNQEDRRIFIDQGIILSGQGRVIPGSGINLDHFQPDDAVWPTSPRFLFIGRAIHQKGIREYVAAARELRSRMPDARFQVLGNPDAGNPSSVTADELGSWAREGVIEHLGEHADVRPFIRAATAVVLPSYREGMSRALLEGAAMGKPLIGSNVPGSRELVEEGKTGALCEPKDANSLASALERIGRLTPGEIQKMGRAARERVENHFSEEIVVQAYVQVLAEICSTRTDLWC